MAVIAADADGSVARVEFFDGNTKIGEDTSAPFELIWSSAAPGSHHLTARAVDNEGAVAISESWEITVAPAPPPNQPPTVAFSAPANDFKPNAPATVTLAAQASDTDGSVASVSFYRIDPALPVFDASTLVGSPVTAAPFQQSTAALPAGSYTFVARATDDAGAVATSASLQVIVNALPTVSFTTPAANAVVQVGASLTLAATAADADGSVTQVEFYDGNTSLGFGTRIAGSNDYTFVWSSVTAGAKSLTARATDNDGATQSTASLAVNANGQPTVALDAPTVGANVPTTLNLAASAADADGGIASVRFFNGTAVLGAGTFDAAAQRYRLAVPVTTAGTFSITARATDNRGGTATSASRSVSIAPNVPPSVAITAPANNAIANAPATLTLTANAADSDGIASVEFYRIDLANPVYDTSTRVGPALTAAPYQQSTGALAAGTYTFVARAIDTVGSTATSTAVKVTVNTLPTVALTSPAANAVLQAGSSVTLTATVADADGSIAKVEFFDGSTPIGIGTRVAGTNDYTTTWTSVTAGAKSLTARATDNLGATQTSASLALTANGQPTVLLDAPVAGANVPTTLTLAATATDADGSIASVQFFNGTALLGTGTFDAATQRYRLAVPVTAAGTFSLAASATDNRGGTATSASRGLTIAPNVPPTVSLTSSSTFTLQVNPVTFTASASDSDGIARVEFYSGSTKLGESTTAPYAYTWATATAGSYSITARAFDRLGNSTDSTAQSVTIAAAPGCTGSCKSVNLLEAANGSLQVTDASGRVIASGGSVPSGSTIVVKAQAQSRFALAAWTANAEVLCPATADACTIPNLTSDLILGAQFKLASFVHPGGLVDAASLTRIRNQLASAADPALAAINASNSAMFAQQTWMPTPAQLDAGAVINYKPNPTTIFYRNYTGPGLGGGAGTPGVCPAVGTQCTAYGYFAGYQTDAYAVFDLALQYRITGRKAYADKAVEILNAWGSTFQQFAVANGSYDGQLPAYIYGYAYFTAAELMRDYAGWSAADFSAFRAMALRAFYPVLKLTYGGTYPWGYVPSNTFGWLGVWSNWFIGPMQSLAAYAILQDDADSFNYAIDYFKKGWTNGQIDRLVYYVHPGNLGQTNESIRDQGHTPLALGQLTTFAEIAWGQGVDLYSYDNHRILAGAEYVAKTNLTLPSATAWSCSDAHPEGCYGVPSMWYQGLSTLGAGRGNANARYAVTVLSQVYERNFGLLARYSHVAKATWGLDGGGLESAPYSDLWATRPYSFTGTATTVTYPNLALCAGGNQTCTVPANTPVLFGSPAQWVSKTMSGSFNCSINTFGVDPVPGSAKSCYTRTTTTTAGVYSTRPPVLSGKTRAGGVQLSWFGSHGVDTYSVQRSTQKATGFQTIASGITDLLTHTDTPTQPGTYYYRVVGTDASGNVLTSPSSVLDFSVGQPRLRYELSWGRNSGAFENDAGGAVFYGTLGKGVSRTLDVGVPVISFDGSKDAYVHLPDHLNVGMGDLSVSAWVKWDGGASWQRLFDLGNSAARYAMFDVNAANPAGTAFEITLNAANDRQSVRGPQLPQNVWTHVVLTFSGTYCSAFDAQGACTAGGNTATLYLNGQQVAQLSKIRVDLDDIGSTTHNYLGQSQYPQDANFKGKLGNFRIYEGALSAAQVTQLYQSGLTPPRP